MKCVAARLGDDVDGCAGEAAVLGLGPEPDDAHFVDRVVVDVDERSEGAGLGIGGVDPVDQEDVLIRGAAVRRRAGRVLRGRRAEHARCRQREVVKGIPARRKLFDELAVDPRIGRGRLAIDERTIGRDGDRLGERPHGQDHVDGRRRVRGHFDVLPYDRLEARQRQGDLVAPRRQVEEQVGAVRRGGRGAFAP